MYLHTQTQANEKSLILELVTMTWQLQSMLSNYLPLLWCTHTHTHCLPHNRHEHHIITRRRRK